MQLTYLGHDAHVLNMRTRMPFRYGIASMTVAPHLFLRVELDVDGTRARGIAADHLPPKWFTKDPQSPFRDDVRDMIEVIRAACRFAGETGSAASPFELWKGTYDRQAAWAAGKGYPPLLWGFGVSLVERAMIDAFCRARGITFAAALRENQLGFDANRLYGAYPGLAAGALLPPRDAVPAAPLRSVIARHTVGLGDYLTAADIPAAERLDDGLPQSLDECIRAYGLTHFKIKLSGDVARDLDRLTRLADLLARETVARGSRTYAHTLDGNENFKEIGPFRRLWESLAANPKLAEFLSKLIFVEQPLHRDVALGDAVRAEMLAWADRPPIIIDESDGSLPSFPRALACGYVGTSHKNCKGVFKSIASACRVAALRRTDPRGTYLLSGEDLSNVGPVALPQDLAVAASLGIDHVERNGHHYFAGLTMLPPDLADTVLAAHGDLYRRHPRGFPTLDVRGGRIAVGSTVDAPLGVAFAFDPSRFTPLDAWDFDSIEQG